MSALQLPTPLAANGQDHEFILSEGYSENMFEGKADQMEKVVKYIAEKGFLPENLIENEVTWFYKYNDSIIIIAQLVVTSALTICTSRWRVLR